jgi:hypothetical protein
MCLQPTAAPATVNQYFLQYEDVSTLGRCKFGLVWIFIIFIF